MGGPLARLRQATQRMLSQRSGSSELTCDGGDGPRAGLSILGLGQTGRSIPSVRSHNRSSRAYTSAGLPGLSGAGLFGAMQWRN